jgi:acyl-CoA oxidase
VTNADAITASPDVEALRSVLDGRWAEVRNEVRETLRDPLFAPRHDLSIDEQRDRVMEQALRIAETSGPKRLFPKSHGGEDNVGASITAFETQGFGDLSLLVKGGVQWGLFGGAIRNLGTSDHHDRYLADVMSLALPGCFAMTETGHGSDVQSVRTTATYDATTGEFVINTPDDDARKDYIGNAARHGRIAAVFAQLVVAGECHGVHALLVPIRDTTGATMPGVRIEDDGPKAGLNGVDNGRLAFDDVRIPRANLLDRYGSVSADGVYSSPIESANKRFFTMVGTLVQGRISVSGAAVSAGKSALAIAIRYGDSRRQFKAPDSDREIRILDFLAHQRALLPALATTYAMHFAQSALVAELDRSYTDEGFDERSRRELETHAAALKAASTWHTTRTVQACREACGGAGYLAVNRLPGIKADTDVFTTFEGDNTVLMQLVAKTLLTSFQSEFGELDTIGTVRFVAEQMVEQVVERTGARAIAARLAGVVPGSDENASLLDRTHQLELFRWREKHVLDGVARRLRKGITAGNDPFDVFNSVQDHILLTAQAHIERRIVEAFASAIDAVEDHAVRELLSQVCDLHVLATVERERGWFMEHGRLTASRSKAVTSAVNDLCHALRPHARLLVDGFGIPDEVLAAPIALGEEQARQEAKGQPADG